MNVLLVNVPSRRGASGFMLPLGLLYVGSILERLGHKVQILDPYADDSSLGAFDPHQVLRAAEEFDASMIGYGGIATSYGRTKELALCLRHAHPEIRQIAGGALASTAPWLLTRAGLDAVVHGESEVSLPLLLEQLTGEAAADLGSVPGISYLRDGQLVRNGPAPQVENLDDIPYPSYHLLDLPRYLESIQRWQSAYRRLLENNPIFDRTLQRMDGKGTYLPIVTGRGCTHRCLFCYRHMTGVRKHSIAYVIGHIKYLQANYGIQGFQFVDELFNPSPEWVIDLCDALDQDRIDIFYLVGGARVNKVTEQMLVRMRDTGCLEIDYGQESGSDTILKEYRKGVTRQMNRDVTMLTRKVGLNCTVQLVIGSPSETNQTISETVRFLKEVDAYDYSLNYLIPLPETPIWKVVEDRGLVPDVESYLDQVAERGGAPLLNLTRVANQDWLEWKHTIWQETRLHYFRKTRRPVHYTVFVLYVSLMRTLPDQLRDLIRRGLRAGRDKLAKR